MAEKPNCSETPNNNPTTRRRTNKFSVLSSVLKTQTSSIQHRACPKIKNKPTGGGLRMFVLKSLIAGGAIYMTSLMGVWGEAEESVKAYSKIKQAICNIDNETFLSDNVKTDLTEKFNKSTEFLRGHLTSLPKEMKSYYEKSERYINELVKGKKS